MPPILTIAVANLKGGSTKTTTAAFVLHALAEAGEAIGQAHANAAGKTKAGQE